MNNQNAAQHNDKEHKNRITSSAGALSILIGSLDRAEQLSYEIDPSYNQDSKDREK